MKLTLGFSPCPNDTFIFDAMIHHKIDTEGLDFEVVMADVEELNQKAFRKELAITKLSYHAFVYLVDDYALLNSGSALGNNCGPLLICKNQEYLKGLDSQQSIAIPGKYTTANFLLSLAFPNLKNKTEVLFSEIENGVLNNQFDAGLIIHENRFTYQEKGLHKIVDLGEFWETKTKMPIPLGGIVIDRNLPLEIQQKVDRVLRRSVQFAFDNPNESNRFIENNAQEMSAEVCKNHIELYVNNYSLDLGENGRKAVQTLFTEAQKVGLVSKVNKGIFVE
jgi:1,4-dihydroxy-6-naphthoate synthase